MNIKRVFKTNRRVRITDCDSKGKLRIDSIARYLQDIGFDDTNDLGLGDGGIWVARSIEILNRTINQKQWPMRNDIVELETHCGGLGKVSAQRDVNIFKDNDNCISAKTIWVSLDENYKPKEIPDWLEKTYPEAINISTKRVLPLVPKTELLDSIKSFEFKIRQCDIDINDHANNSFAFIVLYEASIIYKFKDFTKIYIEYHRPIDVDQELTVLISSIENGYNAWLKASNVIVCSMQWCL
ncbi:MAG: hypothetical protein KBF89_01190 [Acidimicrobiia bacterium]|nr:hypothetical protein [Acidimicrobiia bacterium]